MKLSVLFAALSLSTALVFANPAKLSAVADSYWHDLEAGMQNHLDAETIVAVQNIVSTSCVEATGARKYRGLEKGINDVIIIPTPTN